MKSRAPSAAVNSNGRRLRPRGRCWWGHTPAVRMQRLVLGAELAQCCGGVVEMWMERYTRADGALLRTASDAARRGAALLISSITAHGVQRQIVSDRGSNPGTDPM